MNKKLSLALELNAYQITVSVRTEIFSQLGAKKNDLELTISFKLLLKFKKKYFVLFSQKVDQISF